MFPIEFEGGETREILRARTRAAPTGEGPLLSASAREQPVFIQLGESQARADIFRDEYAIPAFEIDESVIGDIIVGPAVVNKVVSQSIAPGTIVARGTEISVTLAPPETVPGRIIIDGHVALAENTMAAVYNTYIRDDPSVVAVLNRTPDVRRMSSGDQAILAQAAEGGGIDLGDEPGQSVENFARSLHLARTMMES
jgi:hypothetical protein